MANYISTLAPPPRSSTSNSRARWRHEHSSHTVEALDNTATVTSDISHRPFILEPVPVLHDAFVYEPLQDPRSCIRTFQIDHLAEGPRLMSLTLNTHPLPKKSKLKGLGSFMQLARKDQAVTEKSLLQTLLYTAMSYEWGDPGSIQKILVNRQPMYIRSNLWRFLQHLEVDDREAVTPQRRLFRQFWADAICINQKDVEEKNCQVAFMGEIYSNALRVLAWVGDTLDEPVIASLFSFSQAAGGWHRGKPPDGVPHELEYPGEHNSQTQTLVQRWRPLSVMEVNGMPKASVANDMSFFCDLGYWKRTWIIQELALARKVFVLAGPYRIELQALKYMCQPALWQDTLDRLDHYGINAESFTASTLSQLEQFSPTVPLRQLLEQYSETLCQDPRDRVYAFRNMAADVTEHQLLPDYSKSLCELYWEVLALCKIDGSGFEKTLLCVLKTNLQSLIGWSLSSIGVQKLSMISRDYGAMTVFQPGDNQVIACDCEDIAQQKGRHFTTEHGWSGVTLGKVSIGMQARYVVGHSNLAILCSSSTAPEASTAAWAVLSDNKSAKAKAKAHNVVIANSTPKCRKRHRHRRVVRRRGAMYGTAEEPDGTDEEYSSCTSSDGSGGYEESRTEARFRTSFHHSADGGDGGSGRVYPSAFTLRKLERMDGVCHNFELRDTRTAQAESKAWGRISYKLDAGMVLALLVFKEPEVIVSPPD